MVDQADVVFVFIFANILLETHSQHAQPPVAFWPLNKTYTWNSKSGTFVTKNTPQGITLTEGPHGTKDAAYKFTGKNSFIRVAKNPKLNFAASFSITALVQPQRSSIAPILCYKGTGPSGTAFGIMNGKLRLRIYSTFKKYKHLTNRRGKKRVVYVSSSLSVPQDVWSKVGVSYDRNWGMVTFVLNETRDVKQTIPGLIPLTSGDLIIGAFVTDKQSWYFFGDLSSLRLYDKAISFITKKKVSASSTTAVAPGSGTGTYKHRDDLHVGYTRSPTPCIAEEWAYSNQTGNCYMFFSDKLAQAEAIDVCKSIKGELLSIQNPDEQKFLDSVLAFDYEDHWTMGKKGDSGNFTYGGTQIAWTNWLADDLLTIVPDDREVCLCVVKNLFTKGFFLMKGKWDTKPCSEKKSFVCQTVAKRCPALPTAEYVEPHPPKPYIELTIDYKCKPGYVMPNYTARYLDWQQQEPTGNVTTNITEAWQASKPNITTMPSMKYECLFPGKWSEGSLAPCEPTSCKAPPGVKHADRNSSERMFPSWIEYTCQHGWHWGFDNTSSKVAWCGPDTEWIDVPPDCEPVECGPFPRVGNATVNSANNRFKETVIWTCNPGWMFPDRNVRQWVGCRENFVNWQIGRWNISKLDDCIPLECPEPARPPNTTVSSNDTSWQASIVYSCVSDEFEFPNGDEEMVTVCSDEARWKPNVPFCTKKAPKLTLKGKKYAPPPKESPSAQTVGTLAVIIMIVLLVITVLIDLGTCYQGLRFFRHNLRSFQRSHFK